MQQIRTFLRAASVKAVAVDEYNNTVITKASLTRGMQAEMILTLFKTDSENSRFTAADFSSIVSWIWYADEDYDMTTTPKLIVDEGITVDTDGSIRIPILETNTAEVVAYLGKAETKDLKCELVGLSAGDTKPTFVLQWDFSIRNRIGDEGGGSPAPVDDQHYTVAQVNALFAAANTIQYSADGTTWSDTYFSGADRIRYRNSAIQNAEWTYQNLSQGPEGTPGAAAGFDTPTASVASLPAGSSPTASITASGPGTAKKFDFTFAIPAGADGTGITPRGEYDSSVTYQKTSTSADAVQYNGSLWAYVNETPSSGNPPPSSGTSNTYWTLLVAKGNSAGFGTPAASATSLPAGSNPTVSVSASGTEDSKVFSFSFGIPAGQDGQDGQDGTDGQDGADGQLIGASESVSSLTSGYIVVSSEAVPVALKTDLGNLYYLEKGTITISNGTWQIDPAAYLAYDGSASFTGPWTVYFAGGVPEGQTMVSTGTTIVPQDHQIFKHAVTDGETISLDSSRLTSSVCVTFELWLDFPATAAGFPTINVTWIDGAEPIPRESTRFAIAVRWNGTKFIAGLAYTEALA